MVIDDPGASSYIVDDKTLLVQCYDYTTHETYYWKWDGEEYEKVEEYEDSDGVTHKPLPIQHTDRDGVPLVNFAQEPVEYEDFNTLLDEMTDFISKWIYVRPEQEYICAFYALFTWIHDKSPISPYLRFMGEPGTGKSRMVKTIGSISFLSIVYGSGKYAAVRDLHHMWSGTSCFDEADYLSGSETKEIIRWINNGTERRKPVFKTNMDNFDKKVSRDPFGPKIFAMRKPFEDGATESRLIPIKTREAEKELKDNIDSEFYKEALDLRNKLLHFRMQNYHQINPYEESERVKELDIDSRIRQMYNPLYSIIKKGGEELIQQFEDTILQRQKQLRVDKAQTPEGMILNTLVDIATGKDAEEKFDKFRDKHRQLNCVKSEMIERQLGHSFDKREIGRTLSAMTGIEIKNKKVEVKDGTLSEENGYGLNYEKEQHRCILFKKKSDWLKQLKKYRVNYEEEEIEMPDCLKTSGFIDDTEEDST